MIMNRLSSLFLLAAIILLGACGSKDHSSKTEDSAPFAGEWVSMEQGAMLNIGYSRVNGQTLNSIGFIDWNDSPNTMIMAEYTRESPDRISFEWNGKKGTAEYDRSKKTVTLKVPEGNPDESDIEYTFQASDRLDRLALKHGADKAVVYDAADTSIPVDTIYLGGNIPLYSDSLSNLKVILPDGRLGVIKNDEKMIAIHGTPSAKAFEENYSLGKWNEYTDTYFFEKHGNQVLVTFNRLPADGSMAFEAYYLGELDGPVIKVEKSLTNLMEAMEGNFSSTEPLEEPFTILMVEPTPNSDPYIIVNGKQYKDKEYRSPIRFN